MHETLHTVSATESMVMKIQGKWQTKQKSRTISANFERQVNDSADSLQPDPKEEKMRHSEIIPARASKDFEI